MINKRTFKCPINLTVPIIVLIILGSIPFIIKKLKYHKEDKSSVQSNYNTLISINDEQPNVTVIQNKIKPLIDKIIHEELKEEAKDMQFYIKPRHDITLYYLNDFKSGQEKIIEDILKKLESEKISVNDLELSTNLDFFGNINELVILIKNPEKLVALHKTIRDSIQQANDKSRFYNSQKSELYDYKPHITLGRIPKKQSFPGEDAEQEKMVNTIKDRIKKEIFPLIYELIKKNNKLNASKITFYKVPKSSYTVNLLNIKIL